MWQQLLKRRNVSFLLLPLSFYFFSFFTPIGSKANNNIFYFFVLLPFVLVTKSRALIYLFHSRIFIMAVALVSYLALRSFFFEPFELQRSFDPLRHLFSFLVFFSISTALFGQGLEQKLRVIAIWAAGWGAVAACCYYAQHDLTSRLHYSGPISHPILGACVYSVVCLFLVLSKQKKYLIVKFIAVFLLFCCIVLSQSRGPAASLILAVSVAGSMAGRCWLSLFPVAVMVSGWVLKNYIYMPFDRLFVVTSSYRIEIWKQVFVDSWENGRWLFGHSVLASEEVSVGNMVFAHAHSGYVATFFQGGLVGLVLLLALLFSTAWQVYRMRNYKNSALRIGMFVFAALIIFSDTHKLLDSPSAPWFYFWLPLALIASAEIDYCHQKITISDVL